MYNLQKEYEEFTGEKAYILVEGDYGDELYPTDDYVNWLKMTVHNLREELMTIRVQI